MKIHKLFIVYMLAVWPILIFVLFSVISGKACISYHGFAIDKNSNIYVGKNSAIEVTDRNGHFLKIVNPYTSRDYKFTISADDTLEISTGDYLYKADLNGDLIAKKRISDYADDSLIGTDKHKFVTASGETYVMKSILFREYIYRLDDMKKTVVYKMPMFDYAVKLCAILCFLSVMVMVPFFIIKLRRYGAISMKRY